MHHQRVLLDCDIMSLRWIVSLNPRLEEPITVSKLHSLEGYKIDNASLALNLI
jgi:hypothetical protein